MRDEKEKGVTITIRRTVDVKKHFQNQVDRLPRAKQKIERIISDAGACGRGLLNCISILFLLLIIGICAIPIIPGIKDSPQKKQLEEAPSTTTLLILIAVCFFLASCVQFLKKCARKNIVLTNEQDEELIEIIHRYRLPVTWTLYPDPFYALDAIPHAENQIKRQGALYGLKLFDNKSVQISNIVCDYLKEPAIVCET